MSRSSPNKLRTMLAPAIAGLFIVSVTVLALSELVAQTPASIEQQATPKPKPKAAPKPKLTAPLTGTPTPTPSPGPLCIWPPEKDEDKCRVIKAFVKALEKSTKEKQFREDLLKCDGLDCKTPTEKVQKILDDEIENPNKVRIPMVMFYFDPAAASGSTLECPKIRDECPVPHSLCYTVLSLPSDTNPPLPNYWEKPVPVFKYHLRCCYPPWSPTAPCVNK